MEMNYINSEKDATSNKVYKLAALLDKEMEGSYNDILSEYNAMELSDKDKIQILNKELQPIVDKISAVYPDYVIGFYNIELDSVVAMAGDIEFSFLEIAEGKDPPLNSLQNGNLEHVDCDMIMEWLGKSVLSIIHPVIRDNKIIGHTWVNVKLNDIFTKARKERNNIYIVGFILLIMTLLLTKLITNFFIKQLNNISKILFGYKKEEKLKLISEVEPIVKKIKQERGFINRMENELAKLERFNTIGEMAATLAHEVRNPLTTIDGYIQFMKAKTQNEFNKDKLDVISKEVIRVNAIISEYLSFAKYRKTNKEEKDLNSIIKSMYPLLQTDANKKRKSVVTKLGNIPLLKLNEKEIRQVIFNISRNGLEAMEEGGTLEIKTCCEQDKVILSINDEGKGIPEEVIDDIRKPFFTTKTNGTGLGLPVCYRIVENHGGFIDIITGKKGTTFRVIFN